MAVNDDVIGLYWTISGPVEVHVGREWSLFDLRDRCAHAARVGFSGIGIWHADLEHMLETRTLAGDARALRRVRPAPPRARVPRRLVPRSRTTSGARPPTGRARCCSRRRRCSPRTTSRSATSPARRASCRGSSSAYGELCADAATAHRRDDRLRVHAVRRGREHARHRARGRRGRERAERRARDRQLAPRQAEPRARRPAPDPAAVDLVGRAERRPLRHRRRSGSTR